jgi:hypothetical protein
MEIDGTPGVASEAGVEEVRGVLADHSAAISNFSRAVARMSEAKSGLA